MGDFDESLLSFGFNSLSPRTPKQKIPVKDLLEILMQCVRGVTITTIELSHNSKMRLPGDLQSNES